MSLLSTTHAAMWLCLWLTGSVPPNNSYCRRDGIRWSIFLYSFFFFCPPEVKLDYDDGTYNFYSCTVECVHLSIIIASTSNTQIIIIRRRRPKIDRLVLIKHTRYEFSYL